MGFIDDGISFGGIAKNSEGFNHLIGEGNSPDEFKDLFDECYKGSSHQDGLIFKVEDLDCFPGLDHDSSSSNFFVKESGLECMSFLDIDFEKVFSEDGFTESFVLASDFIKDCSDASEQSDNLNPSSKELDSGRFFYPLLDGGLSDMIASNPSSDHGVLSSPSSAQGERNERVSSEKNFSQVSKNENISLLPNGFRGPNKANHLDYSISVSQKVSSSVDILDRKDSSCLPDLINTEGDRLRNPFSGNGTTASFPLSKSLELSDLQVDFLTSPKPERLEGLLKESGDEPIKVESKPLLGGEPRTFFQQLPQVKETPENRRPFSRVESEEFALKSETGTLYANQNRKVESKLNTQDMLRDDKNLVLKRERAVNSFESVKHRKVSVASGFNGSMYGLSNPDSQAYSGTSASEVIHNSTDTNPSQSSLEHYVKFQSILIPGIVKEIKKFSKNQADSQDITISLPNSDSLSFRVRSRNNAVEIGFLSGPDEILEVCNSNWNELVDFGKAKGFVIKRTLFT